MSMIDAVNIIKSEIEPKAMDRFKEFIKSEPMSTYFSTKGFSIFQRNPDEIDGLIQTLEARLEGSKGYPIAKWVQCELVVIKDALKRNKLDIWRGGLFKQTGELDFVIDAQHGEYITCFFPKDWDNTSKHDHLEIIRHVSNNGQSDTQA